MGKVLSCVPFFRNGKGFFVVGLLAPKETFITDWLDCYLSEEKKTGYIATFELANKQHRFFGLNDKDALHKLSQRKKKNMYLSLNAFEYGSRSSDNLAQLRNIGVDVDCYTVGFTVSATLKHLETLVMSGTIPNPNLVIESGKGVQILYSISGGASPKMAFLSHYITVQYIGLLKQLGADPNASDVARVLRLPNSIHGETGKQVKCTIWNYREYTLDELYAYCTPLEKAKGRKKRNKLAEGEVIRFTPPDTVKNFYTLNDKRLTDLEALVQLRNGDMTNYRNTFLYIYSFTRALFCKKQEDTMYFAMRMNDKMYSSTDKPMKKSEVERTIKSAYSDAIAFYEKFAENEFKMFGLPYNLVKPMKTATIIEKLGISEVEMRQLFVTIDSAEKQRRNTEKKRIQRGSVTREEYKEQQQERTEDKLWQLRQAMERYPNLSNRKLAEVLAVSEGYIRKLKKQL